MFTHEMHTDKKTLGMWKKEDVDNITKNGMLLNYTQFISVTPAT